MDDPIGNFLLKIRLFPSLNEVWNPSLKNPNGATVTGVVTRVVHVSRGYVHMTSDGGQGRKGSAISDFKLRVH